MNNNLYYRSHRKPRRRIVRNRKERNFSYLVPFVLIIVVLAVVYFGVVGMKSLFNSRSNRLNNVATVYIVEGKGQVLSEGAAKYTNLLSGQTLLPGDRLQVLKDSRVVVEFFDTTVLRLNEGGDLLIEKIKSNSGEEEINLSLNAGEVWIQKLQSVKPKSTLELQLAYEKVKLSKGVLAVKSNLPEYIRVLEGEAFVDVLESLDDKLNVLDSFSLVSAKESILTNQDYDMFKRRETPSILSDLDSKFKKEEWYKWNFKEDASPSVYEVDPILLEGGEGEEVSSDESVELSEDGELLDEVVDETKSEAPKVVSPGEDDIITTDLVKITGTAPLGAQQILVTSFEDEIPNPYILTGFKPGDRTWLFIAGYQDGEGNMLVGENKYEVLAINEAGEESQKSTLRFVFMPEEGSVSNSDLLDPPEIVSLDGVIIKDNLAEASRAEALLQGVVGSWAKKVVVNGVELEDFVPFSNDWAYSLSLETGTLIQGENLITVYALDTDGVKGPVSTITVNYATEEE